MSSPQNAMHALFDAAREDAPADAQREAMWGRVAVATGLAAGAAAAATAASGAPAALTTVSAASTVAAAASSASATSGALTTKLVVLGGIIGACGTALGVVITLLVVAPTSSGPAAPSSRGGAVVVQRSVAPGARLANPAARRRDTSSLDRATRPAAPQVPTPGAPDARAANEAAPGDTASGLAEEARLVTEARAALVQGDAAKALALVSATKRIANRSLEPEELGLEARALRALGRADDAAATELLLKRRFPDSALAR